MSHTLHKHIVIVGCGRVGVELALSVCRQNHAAVVIDRNLRAFERLGTGFTGRLVQGEGFDRDTLNRAGIETADALAAVTATDSVNFVAGRVARDIYHVPHVVVRVYDPRCLTIYDRFGLQTIDSASWSAERIEQILLHPGVGSVFSSGNGMVQVYEIDIPDEWDGRPVAELMPAGEALLVALARGGISSLPSADTLLHAHDLLQVSATAKGVASIRMRLQARGKA